LTSSWGPATTANAMDTSTKASTKIGYRPTDMKADTPTGAKRDPKGKRVYVIEILPRWHDLAAEKADAPIAAGRKVFYVGKTGRYVGTRYRQHRTGFKAASIFKKIRKEKKLSGATDPTLKELVDTQLRRDLTAGIPDDMTEERALKAESALAQKLRDEGHIVFSN
jgi:hypothetical protein